MANVDIITLSKNDKTKYEKVISFIEKYWEYLTIEELMTELKIKFDVSATKNSIDTIRTSRNLPNKNLVSASRRKLYMVEIPQKLARAIFLKHWDMRNFKTVEEAQADYKQLQENYLNNVDSKDMQKFGRTFGLTEEEKETGQNIQDKINAERIAQRRK